MDRRESYVKMLVETGVMHLQAQECHLKLEEARKEPFLVPAESMALQDLDFRLLAFRIARE